MTGPGRENPSPQGPRRRGPAVPTKKEDLLTPNDSTESELAHGGEPIAPTGGRPFDGLRSKDEPA